MKPSMNTLIYEIFRISSRLLQTFRGAFSLRNVILLLPVGSPAPRLEIWPKIAAESTPLHNASTELYDDIFTSTSDLSDSDNDFPNSTGEPFPFDSVRPFSSIVNCARDRTLIKCRTNANAYPWRGKTHINCTSKRPDWSYDSSSCPVHYLPYGRKSHGEIDSGIVLYDNHCKCHSRAATPLSGKCRQPRGDPLDSDCKRVRRSPRPHSMLRSPAASQRITQLEVELSLLRSQLAELIIRQEKNVPCGISGEIVARADADGQSDGCDSQSVLKCAAEPEKRLLPSTQQSAVTPTVPVTIPKPPPLPPSFPCSAFSKPTGDDWRARLIAKRRGNDESSQSNVPKTSSGDMSQVLRELQSGSIKLRSVPRSPGGTPIRAQKLSPLNTALDPGSLISCALRNRLSRIRAAINVSCSDDGDSQENSFF